MNAPFRVAKVSVVIALLLASGVVVGASWLSEDNTVEAAPNPTIQLVPVATGFSSPLLATNAGDGSERLFVVEQRGTVRVVDDGVTLPGFWLDMRHLVTCCGERGLLGLAFSPDFETSGRIYVSYTGAGGVSTLARMIVPEPATGGPALSTLEVLLTQSQPFSNHNGGHIAFGPDGYLYLTIGDGGSGGDPQNNAQNRNNLLGKIMRLDVSPETGFSIPADNPFASGGGRAEIWAYGLRNPWRFSFDRDTGDLWIADVGQNLVEEIDFQAAGAAGGQNYGWRAWEGHNPYNPAQAAGLDPLGLTFPVFEYNHVPHCSVTGGHVYRGANSDLLQGVYVFGDFCSGFIWGAIEVEGVIAAAPVLLDSQYSISSFGEDEAGEIYVVHYGGAVYRLQAP